MTKIHSLRALEVLDSRGRPTVAVEVELESGAAGRAIVPSGASTGRSEACELRDGDAERYDGLGVLKAVANVNETIARELVGMDALDQAAIDERLLVLDGTEQKTRLGANAMLGTSLAVAHAGAAAQGMPLSRHFAELLREAAHSLGIDFETSEPRLPLPMTNMISGGLHAGGNLDIQDVLVVPHGAASFADALEWIVRVYQRLGKLLSERGYEGRLVGDEGGYGPRLSSNAEALDLVLAAIEAAGLAPGEQMSLALDVAATHMFDGHVYRRSLADAAAMDSAGMIEYLESLVGRYPITSIEDGLAEDDWAGWQAMFERLGGRVQLVGDDLFTTNSERVRRGIELDVAGAVLIKPNQIGTLSETLATMIIARTGGLKLVVSARSGETEDATIADLAVGTRAEQIKIGSVVRSERLAKYNRLLRIAEELGPAAWNW